jgi:transposase InsO family protein
MKHQFITANRADYSVRRLCDVLRISTSGYYAACGRPVSARGQRQATLTSRIEAVHVASRATYGAPRVHAELRAQGETCCRNTVARLMHKAAIVPKTVRRFKVTTDSRHTKASPNLLDRVFTAAQPNDCWLTDITFIPTRAGWLYLAAMIDLHSRAIVGWAMRERMDGKLVMDALCMALERRGTAPSVLHSDQGSLYAMAEYRKLLSSLNIRQSMSRKGNCWDNAPMESFFHTLKTELVMHCDYQTREQARASLFEYMEVFYNRQRRHSSLNYANPLDFEAMNQPLVKVATERG